LNPFGYSVSILYYNVIHDIIELWIRRFARVASKRIARIVALTNSIGRRVIPASIAVNRVISALLLIGIWMKSGKLEKRNNYFRRRAWRIHNSALRARFALWWLMPLALYLFVLFNLGGKV